MLPVHEARLERVQTHSFVLPPGRQADERARRQPTRRVTAPLRARSSHPVQLQARSYDRDGLLGMNAAHDPILPQRAVRNAGCVSRRLGRDMAQVEAAVLLT